MESGAFNGLTNLEGLVISNNKIVSIDKGDFDGLSELSELNLSYNNISNIENGSFFGLGKLRTLDLRDNNITVIERGTFEGLTNLGTLYLNNNQIKTLDFSNLDITELIQFHIGNNPITLVSLEDAVIDQDSFDAIMIGSVYSYGFSGITKIRSVLSLDMGGVDFADVTDLSNMYSLDVLEQLYFTNATNLADSDVYELLTELDSLNYLDVTGIWDTFDFSYQESFNQWDDIEGHILIVPEPGSLMLILLGGVIVKRRCRF